MTPRATNGRVTPRHSAPPQTEPAEAARGSLVFRVDGLPPFSPVAVRVLSMVSREAIVFRQVSEMIRADAALATDVIRLANSPLHGARHEITGIAHALAMLGLERVKALVMTAALRDFARPAQQSPFFTRCWRHNLACALLCEELAPPAAVPRDFAYTAGLLHEIGRLALLALHPREYTSLVAAAERDGTGLAELERVRFAIDYRYATVRLMEQWQMPPALKEAVAPGASAATGSHEELRRLVGLACRLAGAFGFGVLDDPRAADLKHACLAASGKLRNAILAAPGALQMKIEDRINAIECSFYM